MIIQWSREHSGLKLEWMGPNRVNYPATSIADLESRIAVIAGPQGLRGPQGETGPSGGELPPVLDGGNF